MFVSVTTSLQGRAGTNLPISTNRLMGGVAGKHPTKNRDQEDKSRMAMAGPSPSFPPTLQELTPQHASCGRTRAELCESPRTYLCASR